MFFVKAHVNDRSDYLHDLAYICAFHQLSSFPIHAAPKTPHRPRIVNYQALPQQQSIISNRIISPILSSAHISRVFVNDLPPRL